MILSISTGTFHTAGTQCQLVLFNTEIVRRRLVKIGKLYLNRFKIKRDRVSFRQLHLVKLLRSFGNQRSIWAERQLISTGGQKIYIFKNDKRNKNLKTGLGCDLVTVINDQLISK